MTNAERQKRYREKMKALRDVTDIAKRGESVTGVTVVEIGKEMFRDAGKYPVEAAWEIAFERAMRARRYAVKFPHLILEKDLKYQDIGWQYENEGLKRAGGEK